MKFLKPNLKINLLIVSRKSDIEHNINKDPECLEDLSGNPDFAAIKNELKSQLLKELKKTGRSPDIRPGIFI